MASLAPISLASIIIGFISFSFTLLIWLNAFWSAFLTLSSASSEIKDALATLRQALYEERAYLKRIRHSSRSSSKSPAYSSEKSKNLYYEGGPQRVMNDAIKDLIKRFKQYERHFLVTPHEGREKELEWSFDYTSQHYKCDFWHRFLWLRSKGAIEDISVKLERMQTRRIAVEVTEMRFMVGDCMGLVRGVESRVERIEQRLQMSRVGWEEIGGDRY